MAGQALQLDLFGDVEASETRRHIAALTCLRDSVPDALQVVADLRYWRTRDSRAPHACGEWAYVVCEAGLRHEHTDEWWRGAQQRGEPYGWNRTPADLTTWAELTALIGDDPRRAELITWAESLTMPDRWRDLYRPYELWPDPDDWHPSYIDGDHNRPGWENRIAAWKTVLDILDAAIRRTSVAGITADHRSASVRES